AAIVSAIASTATIRLQPAARVENACLSDSDIALSSRLAASRVRIRLAAADFTAPRRGARYSGSGGTGVGIVPIYVLVRIACSAAKPPSRRRSPAPQKTHNLRTVANVQSRSPRSEIIYDASA